MKIKTKSLTCFTLFIIICLLISSLNLSSVSAHDYSPKRYWHDLYYHSGMQHSVVRISYNMDNVSDLKYRQKLFDAVWDWNWHDGGFVEINSDSYNTAYNQGIVMADTWSYTYPSNAYGVNFSYYYPNSTIYFNDIAQSCNKVTNSIIFVNKALCSNNNFGDGDIAHNWLHEIGYSLGFTDTNDGTQSSMRQGKASTFGWSNYWLPQPHDITDLERYTHSSW